MIGKLLFVSGHKSIPPLLKFWVRWDLTVPEWRQCEIKQDAVVLDDIWLKGTVIHLVGRWSDRSREGRQSITTLTSILHQPSITAFCTVDQFIDYDNKWLGHFHHLRAVYQKERRRHIISCTQLCDIKMGHTVRSTPARSLCYPFNT